MNATLPFSLLADLVLVLHVGIIVFVVGGLVLIVVGNLRQWSWVNTPLYRILHLIAIAVVVVEAWLGIECPLTTLETWLRVQGGGSAYESGFIETWCSRILFYEAPPLVFTLAYSTFALLVAAAWLKWPPRRG